MQRSETLSKTSRFSEPFSFFAGPTAWALQLLAGYGLSAAACTAGTKLWIYLVSAAAALVVLLSALAGYRGWRQHARSRGVGSKGMLLETEASTSRQEFVAVSGALLSTVFLLLVLATGVAMVFLNPCPLITQPLP